MIIKLNKYDQRQLPCCVLVSKLGITGSETVLNGRFFFSVF